MLMRETKPTFKCISLDEFDRAAQSLADLLHLCVHQGASIGFVLPFNLQDSAEFWHTSVRPSIATGKRVVIVAELDDRIVGSVQLNCDLMPNQKHRADVSKLLVHPAFRRRGIGRLLMVALEQQALQRKLTLLLLDTRSGDSAELLYASLGFEIVGTVPAFALDPFSKKFDATTYMFKRLTP